MKLLTIIGARPQIIKAAAISRAIQGLYADEISEILVHTGQHYDQNMSEVFFNELNIPQPDYNLGIGSMHPAVQTAKMIDAIFGVLEKEEPNWLLVYGDTNSTLAGSLAANKAEIPLIHIEAGLRSYNKSMPEENNRIVADHFSTLLFCPTQTAEENLRKEGFFINTIPEFHIDRPGIFNCGDVMYDNSKFFGDLAENKQSLLEKNSLKENQFIFFTCHRPVNTDVKENLSSIFRACLQLADRGEEIFMPLHPRTIKALEQRAPAILEELNSHENIVVHPPVSFLEISLLEKKCKMVITDSGGVQKEAFFFKKPCLVLRDETEWVELVESGSAILVGANTEKIVEQFEVLMSKTLSFPQIFGRGNAAEIICERILESS
ncbi:MAG: UDP-N-acetylglucosamine 2-epimerase (non-hydrolyzing) [Bacteroidota bacterium]